MKQKDYKKIKYAVPICKMIQMELTDFMNMAVEKEIAQYLDSKGQFNPRLGVILDTNNKDGTDKELKKCMILDTSILMFGKQYVKVFVDGEIKKISADRIKKTPVKKKRQVKKND